MKNTPKHIAIIMDGNGRWAKKRLLPKKLGHKAGADALQKIVEKLQSTEVEHITVYAFSTENWKRSKEEIRDLMSLLKDYIDKYIKANDRQNVKINMIGDMSVLDEELIAKIRNLEEISKDRTGINLHIALNYGGRDEITRAFRQIADEIENKKLQKEDITEDTISGFLDTRNYNDPELIIRTSGEYRLSNFLTWQCVYSELYFSDKLWPDFTFEDLEEAIDFYKNRERRFGGRVGE